MTEQIKDGYIDINIEDNPKEFKTIIKALNSLQAWEEVLTELKEERKEILHSNDYESEIVNYCLYNFDKAIEIVKQKLELIDEV